MDYNDIAMGGDIQQYQDTVITEVFGYTDKRDFLKYERLPTDVTTWDGKDRALISHFYLEKMATEIGILGPLAAVYGREIEQLLMGPKLPDLIPEKILSESASYGRASLRTAALRSSYQDQYGGSNYSESDVRPRRSTRRTRSPLRYSSMYKGVKLDRIKNYERLK